MGLHGTSAVERALRKVMVPVWALSGALVVSAFFFPSVVGSVVIGGAMAASLLILLLAG